MTPVSLETMIKLDKSTETFTELKEYLAFKTTRLRLTKVNNGWNVNWRRKAMWFVEVYVIYFEFNWLVSYQIKKEKEKENWLVS